MMVFEASGAPQAARRRHHRRLGLVATIVQVGIGADAMPPVPLNTLVAKEINLRGSFRFHEEFAWAVDFIVSRRIDVQASAVNRDRTADRRHVRAFDLASDAAPKR